MNLNTIILNLPLPALAIIAAFALFFLIQMFYYCIWFARVAFFKPKVQELGNVSQEGISVVICARNESENLKKYLPKIFEQDHPLFEVIVVNNCSSDDSEQALALLQQVYPNLITRNIEIDEVFSHNIAMAWGVGIKAARHEWIVLSDANCYPENEHWLAALHQNFSNNYQSVLSYTHSNQNKIVRASNVFETLYAFGKALAGKPYTASGENIAFRKSLFFDNKGFHSLLKVRDKADRVFVNTIARGGNTVVDLSPNAINASSLPLSYSEWTIKKRDEIRSQRLFRRGTRNAGCFEQFSRVAYYALFPLALVCALNSVQWLWITVLSLFVVRQAMQILVFAKTQKQLKEPGILFTSLCWDVLSPIAYLPILLSAKFGQR